jgi:hypothetical protein
VTIDEALRRAVADAARGLVRFPADLHGFPGVVHGGAVGAVFHRLTLPRVPVELHFTLQRGVPTETDVVLRTGSAGATARLTLLHGDRTLAEATLRREGLHPPGLSALRAVWADATAAGGETLPGTATCLACGTRNPLGLAMELRATERLIWCTSTPPETYAGRQADTAHPALALIALDELGWWLGALAQGECGVTTDVTVTLFEPLPRGPLLILGDRGSVRADGDERGRYSLGSGAILSPEGEVLAAATVRFAGSRAYTRRLLEPFLATTQTDRLARWFPSARALAERASGG